MTTNTGITIYYGLEKTIFVSFLGNTLHGASIHTTRESVQFLVDASFTLYDFAINAF